MSWSALEYVRTLKGVTVTEKSVLFALAYRDDDGHKGCWPSLKLLASDAGVSHSTAKRAIREVVRRGLIDITERKREDGSATSNFYSFVALAPPLSEEGGQVTMTRGQVTVTPHEQINQKTDDDGWRNWWLRVSTGHPFPVVSQLVNPDLYFRQAGEPPPPIDSVKWDLFVKGIEDARQAYVKRDTPLSPLVIPVPGLVKALLPLADQYDTLPEGLGRLIYGCKAVGMNMPDWSDALVSIAKNPGAFNYAMTAWTVDNTPPEERKTDFG